MTDNLKNPLAKIAILSSDANADLAAEAIVEIKRLEALCVEQRTHIAELEAKNARLREALGKIIAAHEITAAALAILKVAAP
jgi:phage shock protein A